MTRKELFDNICNGFTPNDKIGYSVKKMLAALATVVMLVISVVAGIYDKSFVMPLLSLWLPFILSLIVTAAVEKNNVLKNTPNEKSADIPVS